MSTSLETPSGTSAGPSIVASGLPPLADLVRAGSKRTRVVYGAETSAVEDDGLARA